MKQNSLFSCSCWAVLALFATPALAQNTPEADPDDGLGTITVTAQRTAQNIQKVSQSITSIDGDKLEKLGIRSAADIAAFVPGVAIKPGNSPAIFIRGIGTSLISVTGDPGVAVHIDGVFQPRSTALGIGFFDLDRVEILKGPQGTLYGRGSVGGSVNLITAAPAKDLAAQVSLELGSYNAVRATAMVNVPIDEQSGTAIRIAGLVDDRNGYASNGADNLGNRAVRARLRTQPLDGLTVDLNGTYFRGKATGVGFYPARSYGPGKVADADHWITFVDASKDFSRLLVKEGVVSIDYDLGFGHLTFIPSWVSFDDQRVTTNLATIGGVVAANNSVRSNLRSNTAMQELRLASRPGSPVTWVTGLYHLREDNTFIVANGRISGKIITDSKSAFAQATVPLAAGLRLVGGGRYTKEVKDQTSNVGLTFHKEWSVWNYRVSGEYDIAPAAMVYATYATGFKAGGFFVSTPPNSYDPETVKTFELGTKNRFLDNRLQINAALYLSKYNGYQVNVTIVPAFVGATSAGVFNGGNTEVKGAELELLYQLSPTTRFQVSGNYTDGRFKTITLTGTTAKVGDRMPSTARFSANLAIDQQFSIPGGTLDARAETRLESDSWLSLNHNALTRQKGYSRSNLTLTFTPEDRFLSVSAFVRNIENVAVRGSIVETVGNETYTLGAPRTYGIGITKKF